MRVEYYVATEGHVVPKAESSKVLLATARIGRIDSSRPLKQNYVPVASKGLHKIHECVLQVRFQSINGLTDRSFDEEADVLCRRDPPIRDPIS